LAFDGLLGCGLAGVKLPETVRSFPLGTFLLVED
jgi:hypothetical protein